ncbi:MAG: urea ABC transporter permease subunit UrtB [Burkholderiales bacterium]|nr:urea ABC transporter permease subunit UrtB [Burkholderiales bacterium]
MSALAAKLLTRLLRFCFIAALLLSGTTYALSPNVIAKLALGDSDERIEAINAIVAAGDASAIPVLQALQEGRLQTAGERALIVEGETAIDAASGQAISPLPENREDVLVNNRLRRALGAAIAALRLSSPDRDIRLAAANALQGEADESLLPAISKAFARESDPEIKNQLALIGAATQLQSDDPATRLAAVKALAQGNSPNTKTLLLGLLEKKDDAYVERDPAIRGEAQRSLNAVESRIANGERIAQIFSGISLGSILLLAALGLAITYGLMGVINMAHGEMIMIGAYATYLVQNAFRDYAVSYFDWYLLCAVPVAFSAAALVGMLVERSVIRFLYGRPLETLLATWGISLILIQTVRTIFGAQNVGVENPSWMSGGIEVVNAVLPYNRVVIIGFAFAVLALAWLLLNRTRLGLFVRGVTQNRAMASCVGVPTARVDTLAFGLGSGIAGLAGCALSQIGNVGPDLGQSYIVDSFMVVVLGGVGQLAGTVYAALGLGVVNKYLEAWQGAVLAKIAVLVFIIIFIQKRPQGLFALKGRMVEA